MSNKPPPQAPDENKHCSNQHDDLTRLLSSMKLGSSSDDPGYAGLCSLMNTALRFMEANPMNSQDQAAMFRNLEAQISKITIQEDSKVDVEKVPSTPVLNKNEMDDYEEQSNEEVFSTPRGETPNKTYSGNFTPFSPSVPPVPESTNIFYFGSAESKVDETLQSGAKKNFKIPFNLPNDKTPVPEFSCENSTGAGSTTFDQFPPAPDCSFDNESPQRVQTSFEPSGFSMGSKMVSILMSPFHLISFYSP